MSGQGNTGPLIGLGSQAGSPTAPDNNPYEGPLVHVQGTSIIDPRVTGLMWAYGRIPAFMQAPSIVSMDAVPAASAATPVNIAAAANAVSGTPATLVTSPGAGIATNIPFLDYTGQLRTSAITLDFGFTTLNCTSGNPVVAASSATIGLFSAAQWLVIANVGNSGGTIPLIARVMSISGNNLTLSTAPLATNTTAPVGQGNVVSPYSVATAIAWTPYIPAGVGRMLNPRDAVSRGIGIGGSASATGGAFLVSSYDIYGYLVTMTITAAAGVGPTYGTKAVKHIMSVTPQFSDAHAYSVGTGDVFGFNIRNLKWEYANLFFNGALLTTSTGWTAADQTNPATSATGDVRGTIQFGTRGPLGSGAGSAISGSQRVFIQSYGDPVDQALWKSANPVPFVGVTQA